MNKSITLLTIILLLFSSLAALGQSWAGLYNQGMSQFQSKEYKAAEKSLMTARMHAATEFGNDHENYRKTLELLGDVYFEGGDYRNSVTNYTVVEKMFRDDRAKSGKSDHARLMDKMGQAYERGGRYPDAARYYQQALDMFKADEADTKPEYFITLHRLARLNKLGKRLDQANALYNQLYAKGKAAFSVTDKEWREILFEKAEVAAAMRKHPEAVLMYEEMIKASKTAKAPKMEYAQAYFNISQQYLALKDYEKLEASYDTYISFLQTALGKKETGRLMEEIDKAIETLERNNRNSAAKKLREKKLAVQKAKTSEDSPEYAAILFEIAMDERKSRSLGEAEKKINRVLEIQKKTIGMGSAEYANSLDELARIQWAKGDAAKAEELFIESLNIRKSNLGETHNDYTSNLDSLAYMYMGQERLDEADSLINKSLKIREEALGKSHGSYGLSLYHYANLLTKKGQFKEAEPLYKQAGRLIASFYGSMSKENAMNVKKTADMLRAANRGSEAVRTYQSAILLIEGTFGTASPMIPEIQARIKEITATD